MDIVDIPSIPDREKRFEVLADQLWADETGSANATVLDDYRAYIAGGGLLFDPYEEE